MPHTPAHRQQTRRQQIGPRPAVPQTFQGGSLIEMQQAAATQFGRLGQAEQAQAGGFWNPTAAFTRGSQAGQVMGAQWMPFQAPQPVTGGVPAPGAAAAGGLPGGPEPLAGEAQGFGAMQQDLAETLFEQTMAPLAADFGRRGLASSSMFGAAAARASAEAQMSAFTQMEQIRRTSIAERSLGEQIRSSTAREELERNLMRQNWNVFTMQLDAQGDWQNIAQGMGQIAQTPPDIGFAPPFRDFGPGPGPGPGPQPGPQPAPGFLDERQGRLDERQRFLTQQETFGQQQRAFEEQRAALPVAPDRLSAEDFAGQRIRGVERALEETRRRGGPQSEIDRLVARLEELRFRQQLETF